MIRICSVSGSIQKNLSVDSKSVVARYFVGVISVTVALHRQHSVLSDHKNG